MTRVIVPGVTRVVVTVHRVHVVPGVHVVTAAVVEIMWASGSTAVMPFLHVANQVVFLITLAFIRWAVAFAAGVVVADTHHRVY